MKETPGLILLAIVLYVYYEWTSTFGVESLASATFHYVKITAACVMFILAYHYLGIHEKYGLIKGVPEPKTHMTFSLKTIWIVMAWCLGQLLLSLLLGTTHGFPSQAAPEKFLRWQLPEQYIFCFSNSTLQDWLWGILGFYVCDFGRYWTHRIGHWGFFFKTFPFSHAHHHNQIFLTPLVTAISPLVHPAAYATFIPLAFMASQRLYNAMLITAALVNYPTLTQHLGADPFPWLSRWNHLYFYGALPHIPVYHQYHHLPFIKAGNFGNTSVLFDYVFGTVTPESVEHIMAGEMPERIREKVRNYDYDSLVRHRNRLDMNPDDKSWWEVFGLWHKDVGMTNGVHDVTNREGKELDGLLKAKASSTPKSNTKKESEDGARQRRPAERAQ